MRTLIALIALIALVTLINPIQESCWDECWCGEGYDDDDTIDFLDRHHVTEISHSYANNPSNSPDSPDHPEGIDQKREGGRNDAEILEKSNYK